ncbi:MAG TPA: DNA polymerase III subunit gamma/tau, partial [Xanthobacteraceae bacterium]|nr:DNA polymerase III subunit gamma/tau [Xanthobacteraceae bacterium]
TWQMLLKGMGEVESAGRPIDAAEMVLVRIAYAADLPTPDEVIRSLGEAQRGYGGAAANVAPVSAQAHSERARMDVPRTELPARGQRGPIASANKMTAPAPIDTPTPESGEIRVVESFEDLIALAVEKRDLSVKSALERDVRLVHFEDGNLEIALETSARKMLIGELSKKLSNWTGRRWMVVVSTEAGSPSIRAQTEMRRAELKDGVRGEPLVQAVLTRFPGAEIVDVRPPPSGTPGASIEDSQEAPPSESEEDR